MIHRSRLLVPVFTHRFVLGILRLQVLGLADRDCSYLDNSIGLDILQGTKPPCNPAVAHAARAKGPSYNPIGGSGAESWKSKAVTSI